MKVLVSNFAQLSGWLKTVASVRPSRLTIGAVPAAACLFGFFTILTALRIPATLARMVTALRPNGGGVRDDEFMGFSSIDTLIRPAYRRIASNFALHGRYGYTWGDAFGLTMRERFGNSSITYRLLHRLGDRAANALGWGLFIAATALAVALGFTLYGAPFAALAFAASPVIVFSYTSGGGKTETLWYGPILMVLFLAFSGNTLVAALLWSLLAVANLMGSLLTAAITGPALLVWALQHGDAGDLIIGVLPGLALHLLRFSKAGFPYLVKTVRYCRFASRDVGAALNGGKVLKGHLPVLDEIVAAGPVALSLIVGAWLNRDPAAALLGLTCFLAYYTSRRFLFLSDFQSFDLLFVAIGIAYACATGNPWCLLICFIGAHRMRDNPYCCVPLGQSMRSLAESGLASSRDRWYAILRHGLDMSDAFPLIRPIARPKSAALDAFFAAIPDRSRIAVETIRNSTAMQQAYPDVWMRGFWFMTDDILPRRDIELATKEYTFTLEHELSMNRLLRLNAIQTPPDRFLETCSAAGISHVVALSRATMEMLSQSGWTVLAGFDFSQMDKPLRDLLNVDVPGMILMGRTEVDIGIVTPQAPWRREGNRLVIEATAGTTYTIRYRHFPEFRAEQGAVRLPVIPYQPFDDVPSLSFMRVTAAGDGPLTLRYVDYPGRVLLNRLARRFVHR
ncbi:hypothetical protein A6A40_23515 (plasmid) [Azospirillum humicireducens]|uniref:Uncharacterized protein n=1 Tax=Azospirillum humicireducens TaxID=1226968 RepID=A0A2R4VU97_9PROT|nr:hypothetical protein [Azospirillum humicireducens]AWB08019.1 hypothetical protein A6A40_23515 [Azospirillum humicireducens]